MANTTYFALALAIVVACCMYKFLYNWRLQKFKHLPQLPNSLLFGHLKLIGEYYKQLGDARLHIGMRSFFLIVSIFCFERKG